MNDPFDLVLYVIFAIVAFSVFRAIVKGKRAAAATKAAHDRQEALFKATFPELQPYFHPEKVLRFVDAWRLPGRAGKDWDSPPGLGVARARFGATGPKGQGVDLLDASGARVASFLIQPSAEGAVMRIGPGKLTVNGRDAAVRYWHPQREFKWSRTKGWRLISALSDREIESSDHGSSFSSDSSSSPSRTSTAAAAAAGAAVVAGAGGAFDGGGASNAWDAGAAGDSGSPGDSTGSEAATSY